MLYNTHTHTFNGPLSGTTWVSRYQKGKTNLDFTEARDSEWQWRQLGHMQVSTLLQTDNHARVVPEKGPLNVCVCVCVCLRACVRACLLIVSVKAVTVCLQAHQSNRVCNALALLQCVASHPETRSAFLQGTQTFCWPVLSTLHAQSFSSVFQVCLD